MMFQQTISRNQRTKGSKIKRILQVTLLLAVAIWLLYQIKHSHDKKTETAETDQSELSKGVAEINFGRKSKAGSENVIIIDAHNGNSDETTETKGSGEDQVGTFDWHSEEKAEEGTFNHEHEESQDVMDSGKEDSPQKEKGNKDDNSNSYITGGDEVTDQGVTEGKEEVLRLPSQSDSDNSSFDQNEHRNGDNGSPEEKGENELLPKDDGTVEAFTLDGSKSDDAEAAMSDEENITSSTIQTELSDNAVTGAGLSSSLSDDQSNSEFSTNEVNKGEDSEFQGVVGSDTEVAVSKTGEEAASDDELANSSLVIEQNDVAASDSNSLPRDTVKQESDDTEVKTSEHQITEADSTNTKSEDEDGNLPSPTEENNVVMPDNNGAPKREEVKSQVDNAIEAEILTNNSSEESKTDARSDDEPTKFSLADEMGNGELPANNDASVSEAVESQGDDASVAKVSTNNAVEEGKDQMSSDEVAKYEHHELPANQDAKEETVGSHAVGASEIKNFGNNFEEAKSETTVDEAASSDHSNEQNNLEISTDVKPKENAIGTQGDSDFKSESTQNDSIGDGKIEPRSNDVSSSDFNTNNELSGERGNAETGQEGSTDSESSSSEEDATGLKAAQ